MPLVTVKKILLRALNSPWLWVSLACLPSLVIFADRILVPEWSTDTISYHLYNGMQAFHNFLIPFSPHEFFPVGIANISPGYDALTYAARSIAGYRLGTGLSLLAALGCIFITYRLLGLLLKEQSKRFHAGWGLLLVNAGIILELQFQLATYFIDVINAFFVLLALYGVVRAVLLPAAQTLRLRWWCVLWLVCGALLAGKLTNAALVIPLMAIMLWDGYRRRGHLLPKRKIIYLACCFLLFLPLLPGWIQNYQLSHNPVFPYYNAAFQSPYYPAINYTDTTFGGQNTLQKAVWPVASLGNQLRLGEPHHIYNDFKLATYWVLAVAVLGLLLLKRLRLQTASKVILFYFLSSLFIWGMLFGINRYIIPALIVGGLVACLPFLAKSQGVWRWIAVGLGLVACVVLSVESYRSLRFNFTYDMSWRPPYLQNQQLHKAQLSSLFAKHLSLTLAEQATVKRADILLNCHTNVSGLDSLLPGASGKPMVSIIADQLPQYAALSNNPLYRKTVKQRLDGGGAPKLYHWVTVVSDNDIGPTGPSCYKNIAARGGRISERQLLPSFMGYDRIHLTLLSGTITL